MSELELTEDEGEVGDFLHVVNRDDSNQNENEESDEEDEGEEVDFDDQEEHNEQDGFGKELGSRTTKRQRDPLAQVLFQSDGHLLPDVVDKLEAARTRCFFVNANGVQQSCVPRNQILAAPRTETPAPSSGHVKTTATCTCVRSNGQMFDVRISNFNVGPFRIGDLVVYDPECDEIRKDLREDVAYLGFFVVSLTKTALGLHRLVVSLDLGHAVHISGPQKCFKRYMGSERQLVEQSAGCYSGQVSVTSFCEYELEGKTFVGPNVVTLEKRKLPPAPVPTSKARKKRKAVSRQKKQDRIPMDEEQLEQKDDDPNVNQNQKGNANANETAEDAKKRGRKKAKLFFAKGTPKITSFFMCNNEAAAIALPTT